MSLTAVHYSDSEKPCIDKEFQTPLMHGSVTFHIQDSGNTPSVQRKHQVCS